MILSMDITPCAKLVYRLIKANPENILLISVKNKDMIKKATVIIPAMIWFSVILDANIPTDKVAILIKTNPNIATSTCAILGSPKNETIK